MVIDTSAILAILFNEPDAPAFELAIESDPVRLMSAASFLETAIVVEARLGDNAGRELDLLIYRAGITIVSVTAEQAEVGRDAFRRFGRGRHAAALNSGDCFAYALSHTTGEPVLSKGHDFEQTDVTPVRIPKSLPTPFLLAPGDRQP